jgi:enoyl reductase-like protein
MLRMFFIGIALLTTTAALCQNKKEMDEPVHHFCVNINAGLGANYNTWFLDNGSLKFEITAKRLYAASQRVL